LTTIHASVKIGRMETVVPYLSTGEVAKAVGMTSARVRQMAIAGEILAEKFGRDWHIDPREVDRLRKKPPGPGRPRGGGDPNG